MVRKVSDTAMQGEGVRGEDSEKNRTCKQFFPLSLSPPLPSFSYLTSFRAVKNDNHTKNQPAMQPTYNQVYEIFTSMKGRVVTLLF